MEQPTNSTQPTSSTTFQVGDVLVARESVQGMRKGVLYTVVGARQRHVLGMPYVNYQLKAEDTGEVVDVANAHLLLQRDGTVVEQPQPLRRANANGLAGEYIEYAVPTAPEFQRPAEPRGKRNTSTRSMSTPNVSATRTARDIACGLEDAAEALHAAAVLLRTAGKLAQAVPQAARDTHVTVGAQVTLARYASELDGMLAWLEQLSGEGR